jgi:hypothetical protein
MEKLVYNHADLAKWLNLEILRVETRVKTEVLFGCPQSVTEPLGFLG